MESHINLVLASTPPAGGAASGVTWSGRVGWGGGSTCGGGSTGGGGSACNGARGGSSTGDKTGGGVIVTDPVSDFS